MAIYLSLGPSGAGKDTLLLAGRALLAGNSDVVFIQRHLTRNAASVTDLEISVTSDEFAAGLAANTYALHWEAHGTQYGVPSAELSAALGQGRRCVLNVSRTQEEPCPVGAVALVCTTGESYACWQIVETIPLPSP